MKTFQVTQKPGWSCPGMLVFVNEDGRVIGHQQNPNNPLTQNWAEDGEDWGVFNPKEYAQVQEV